MRLPSPSQEQRLALLFAAVKAYFLPIILNFFFSNLSNLSIYLNSWQNQRLVPELFPYFVFPLLVALIFVVDTLYFSFGYAVEAGFLRNNVRSVEPTVFRWAVALMSYPPFSTYMVQFIGWYPDLHMDFSPLWLVTVMRAAILALLLVYVAATIALGAKCSNLTNRGIVSSGPYGFVRHPAYASKVVAWWLVLLPLMSHIIFLSMAAWSFIYFLRAITEERHLLADQDYVDYCRKVRYRFIPFVY